MAKKTKSFSEANVLAEMAKELDVPKADLEIEKGPLGSGSFRVSTGPNRSWVIVENEDAAEALALAQVREDLENEPERFTRTFMESHIDTDRLLTMLEADVLDMLESDLRDDPRQAKRLGLDSQFFLEVSSGTSPKYTRFPGVYDSDYEATEAGEVWKAERIAAGDDEDDLDYSIEEEGPSEEAIREWAEEETSHRLRDPIAYLAGIYGDEEAVKEAIRIGGIDIEAAAEDAVRIDGWAHFLCQYDGNSQTTSSGFVYWREN